MNRELLLNKIFRSLTYLASASIIFIIAGMLITLLYESWPAIKHFGFFKFISTADWNFNQEIYGALRPLTGTLLTSILALITAIPIALGTAVFLTELCPYKLRASIGTAIELLAAIPSIIYGMWGLFVLAPFLEKYVQPVAAKTLGLIPLIGSFFQSDYAGGVNIFTAAMILAVMIIPFIASIARDAFNQVPPMLKESSYGLGSTQWETVSDVVIPFTKKAIAGGIIIAMGRALGETMAVAYVIGNRHGALDSIFSPYTTITSVMANEFNEASGLQMSSLFTLALVLFLVNFILIYIAKFMVKKAKS